MTQFNTQIDQTNGVVIKLVPDTQTGGVLDPKARAELVAAQTQTVDQQDMTPPDIATLPAAMGGGQRPKILPRMS